MPYSVWELPDFRNQIVVVDCPPGTCDKMANRFAPLNPPNTAFIPPSPDSELAKYITPSFCQQGLIGASATSARTAASERYAGQTLVDGAAGEQPALYEADLLYPHRDVGGYTGGEQGLRAPPSEELGRTGTEPAYGQVWVEGPPLLHEPQGGQRAGYAVLQSSQLGQVPGQSNPEYPGRASLREEPRRA